MRARRNAKHGRGRRHRLLWLILLLTGLLLIGCGEKTGREQGTAESSETGKGEKDEGGDLLKRLREGNKKTEGAGGFTEQELETLLGEWTNICWTYSYFDEEGEKNTNFTMAEDGDGAVKSVFFYVEDGVLYADYRDVQYQYSTGMTYYHVIMEKVEEPLYEGAEGPQWSLVGEKGRWAEEPLRFALNAEQDLMQLEKGSYGEDDEWESVSTFLKEGTEKIKHASDYRYSRIVTVSTAEELAEAIGDRTKIILKPGVYDLSEIGKQERGGDHLTAGGSGSEIIGFYISSVRDLYLMAESEELTELCIDDSLRPVLPFYNCGQIKLSGLTLGHRVEPGTCSGSVVFLQGCDDVQLQGCHLYGSGSYGLEAESCYNINLKDTEIYECTYGIISLWGTYMLEAENCDMHDSTGFQMLDFNGSYSIRFTNCSFRKNGSKEYNFMTMPESASEFTDCRFEDNIYKTFSDGMPEIERCSFHDNL